MYLADDLLYKSFGKEEYNNFQYWREPIMDLNLDGFEVCDVVKKQESSVSVQYDSFLYWRDPIPDLEEL